MTGAAPATANWNPVRLNEGDFDVKALDLVSAAVVATAMAPPRRRSRRRRRPTTVVLVHGAFADGSSWNGIIPLLQAEGLNVVAVQNPLTSLADDVAATRRAIDLQKGPIVLVGHSWAGTVITEAGDDDRVKALVYVAAFAPGPGETTNQLGKDYPAPRGSPARSSTRRASCPCRRTRSPITSPRTCRRSRRTSSP